MLATTGSSSMMRIFFTGLSFDHFGNLFAGRPHAVCESAGEGGQLRGVALRRGELDFAEGFGEGEHAARGAGPRHLVAQVAAAAEVARLQGSEESGNAVFRFAE